MVGFAEPVLDGSNRVSALKFPSGVLSRLLKDENPIRQLFDWKTDNTALVLAALQFRDWL